MLCLTRKIGQKVVINQGEIIVSVMENRCGGVTLGIEAPANISIDREEIYLCKQQEQNARKVA